MNIRVAFDVSVLGMNVGRPDSKTGIARVAEELLFELSATHGIELTAVALTGGDPLLDSVQSDVYVRSAAARARYRFAPSFRSRLRLGRLYQMGLGAALVEETLSATKGTTRALFWRGLRSIFYRLNTYGIDRCEYAFDNRRYDVYHSPNLTLPPADLTGGVPRVLTVYDLIPILAPQFVTAYQIEFLRQLLDQINVERDWVTCISEYTKAEFCEYKGMRPERVFVAKLAAATHFRPVRDQDLITAIRCRYGVPKGNYFLSLAAPQPRKNLVHLIRCYFRLLEEQPGVDANLVLAGSTGQGWLYDEIFAAAAASPRHRDRVIFTGFVADEHLAPLYSDAVAFVFPSLYEGFGLPPLEAMACGTPVITSNTTALPEVVGDAGLMVDPHDEDALCQAMQDVLRDERLRRHLRSSGLDRAARFSWKRCAEETVVAYRAAVGESDRRT